MSKEMINIFKLRNRLDAHRIGLIVICACMMILTIMVIALYYQLPKKVCQIEKETKSIKVGFLMKKIPDGAEFMCEDGVEVIGSYVFDSSVDPFIPDGIPHKKCLYTLKREICSIE